MNMRNMTGMVAAAMLVVAHGVMSKGKKFLCMALIAIGLGFVATSTSIGAITMTGSFIDGGTNYDNFFVSYSGVGTLRIDDGSLLTRSSGFIGFIAGSTGNATVTGIGSTWTNTGYLYVGRDGRGTLNIQAGGLVSNSTGYLGYNAGSTGTATVTGIGSTWTNSGELYVGRSGSGTLTVANGGLVTAGSLFASLSDLSGNGTITVSKGAVLDTDLVFDTAHGLMNTISFGSGGTLNLTVAGGTLGAGYKGTGTLRITDGINATSATGYLGYNAGSTGTATVTGTGSTWTNSDRLYVGYYGSGTLNIQAGGQVSNSTGFLALGYYAGSTGTATVTGIGSTWTNTSSLYVGHFGSGTLIIQDGGLVSNSTGYLGYQSGSTGTATVTRIGSTWTNSGNLFVGFSGSGKLTVADGGKATATSVNINNLSAVRLNVSGNGMLVLGSSATVGSITNKGTINFYASPFLAAGTYTPISEYSGRAITWSGTGSYKAVGGVWDSSAKAFTVVSPLTLAAGGSRTVATGNRLVFNDPATNQRVGVSFGIVTGTPTFSASPMGSSELNILSLTDGYEGTLMSAWNFDTNLTGSESLLAFDIGMDAQNLAIWHYSDGVWTPYSADMLTYDSNGILSFNTTTFDGYAVVSVPEPVTMSLLVIGGLALLRRRRK